MDYQYQLVVTRAYEEGEEQLLDEDAESMSIQPSLLRCCMLIIVADDERVFLIDEALEFRFGSLDGDATCAWNDLSGDDGDLWEFVSSRVSLYLSWYRVRANDQSVPKATNGIFEITVLNCVYERVSFE